MSGSISSPGSFRLRHLSALCLAGSLAFAAPVAGAQTALEKSIPVIESFGKLLGNIFDAQEKREIAEIQHNLEAGERRANARERENARQQQNAHEERVRLDHARADPALNPFGPVQ